LSEITFGLETATFLIVFFSAVYGVYLWNKKRKETDKYEKLMENPVEVHFLIPAKKLNIELKYEKQDEEDHIKDELTIPQNFEDHIILLIRPKLNLSVNDRYFGFGPHDGKIPELSYSNIYVTQSSDQSAHWYIDRYGCIHFDTEKQFFKDETYLLSIKIKTYDKGSYPLEITFNVMSNEYKEVKKEIGRRIVRYLSVRVE
jgi:hypothetical protein